MKRAVIYARFSDADLQSAHSIEDQVRICRERATTLDVEVIEVFADYGISGMTIAQRPQMQRLLRDAERRAFDMVIAEDLDRLSRGQADTATIFEDLTYNDVQIFTLADGVITELHVGLKGTMGALFLKNLAAKVRRGQRGQVERGRAPGGIAYGYRVVRKFGDDGRPVTGLREIDPGHAAIVQRIYREYVAGKSSLDIARGLNLDGIPSPRGGRWTAASIGGNRARAGGILYNRIYVGEVTYGRMTFRRDPRSGKREGRKVDQGQWFSGAAPDLRIIDDATWGDAQRVKAQYSSRSLKPQKRVKHVLSGLVFCDGCGSPFIMVDKERMGCSSNRNGHGCRIGRRIGIEALEAFVFQRLREEMIEREAFQSFMADYQATLRAERASEQSSRARLERDIADTNLRLGRLAAAIADGADFSSLKTAMTELETHKAGLTARLQVAPRPVVVELPLDPSGAFAKRVGELRRALQDPDLRAVALGMLRGIVSKISAVALPGKSGFAIEIEGKIREAYELAVGQKLASSAYVPDQGILVAEGGGFEPPIGL